MKDLSNHSSSSHIRRYQAIEAKATQSHSKTVTAKSQELNEVLFTDFCADLCYATKSMT